MEHSLAHHYKNTVQQLKGLYVTEEAQAMADQLFSHFFNLSPVQRVISGKLPADQQKLTLLNNAIQKLLYHVPLQYVLGKAWFMDMEFDVNPSVLIPRPETEELVDLIVKYYSNKPVNNILEVMDIGTGSGCIAIALYSQLNNTRVTAIDISEEALNTASRNAAKNAAEINFIAADILDQTCWHLFPKYNLIVSNPPYVTFSEKSLMLPNVTDYEPHTALFVTDNDPLIFYKAIFLFAKSNLLEGGSLWFEINEMFGNELKTMAFDQGFSEVNIIFDIRGKSRFLQCLK